MHIACWLTVSPSVHCSGGGCLPRGVPCDLSHHAFDVSCMLSCHQLRLITSAAAYIVFGHVTCGVCWDTPPLDRMTDKCKNITLANFVLRAVKIQIVLLTWIHPVFKLKFTRLYVERKQGGIHVTHYCVSSSRSPINFPVVAYSRQVIFQTYVIKLQTKIRNSAFLVKKENFLFFPVIYH